MKILNQLMRMRKSELVKIAKGLDVKGITHSNKAELAKKIREAQKIQELYQEPEPVVVSEPEGPQRKPEFEDLLTEEPSEMPVSVPETPQEPRNGRGGYREGAGRTPGLTDEKVRAQRVLRNEVPDPAIEFVVEQVFSVCGLGDARPKKETPTPKAIALPLTNLLSYYFPNLRISPVLKVWFDLVSGIEGVVVSRIQAMKSQPEPEKPEQPVSEVTEAQ